MKVEKLHSILSMANAMTYSKCLKGEHGRWNKRNRPGRYEITEMKRPDQLWQQ